MSSQFSRLDATAQAELVRRGEVTPIELVDAAIERIERLNPLLNAVVTPLFEKARAQAESTLPTGPFRGVPLLLKDYLCQTAGDPYYEGMGFLRALGWCATDDTHLAARLRSAGFVFLGKTNLPELALGPVTEPRAFGATRNPWNLGHSTGGSSGGSAAAVASGMVAVAHGNDGTGSIRIPASCCGLVGLKPSRGRVSVGPGRVGGLLGNVVEHVLTRTVRDAAAILDVTSGPRPGDFFVAPPPQRPFRDEVGRDPGRLRVGLLLDDPFLDAPIDPEVSAAVRETGSALAALGHHVEESSPPGLRGPTGLGPDYLGAIGASSVAAALDVWTERTGRQIGSDDVEPETWEMAERGRSISAVQIQQAVRRIASGVGRVPEWWESGHDLLVTPTMLQLPPLIGGVPRGKLGEVFGLFAMPFSITGQPAISLPLYTSQTGLPIGVQLVAGFGREDLLLRVSAQLEAERPWRDRWPAWC